VKPNIGMQKREKAFAAIVFAGKQSLGKVVYDLQAVCLQAC
jgi:hypothetical protein